MNQTKPNSLHENEQRQKATLDLGEPSDELLEWAKENIHEDPDTKDLMISNLKDMIFEKGECTPTRLDDDFLLMFLRARHFDINKAHRLYVNHHNFMEEAPEYFKNVNLHRLSEIKKLDMFNCPINYDQNGRRMMIIKIGEWAPSEFTVTELLQFVIFLIQVGILEQKTQIKGVVTMFDLSGLSLEMVWYMTPTLARHLLNITMSAMPTRIEAVHFLYSSWMFDTAFNTIKVLIPHNVRDRIHFHKDLETLYTHVDPKHLPASLGGAQEDFSMESWYNDVSHSENEKVKRALEELGYPVQEFINTESQY